MSISIPSGQWAGLPPFTLSGSKFSSILGTDLKWTPQTFSFLSSKSEQCLFCYSFVTGEADSLFFLKCACDSDFTPFCFKILRPYFHNPEKSIILPLFIRSFVCSFSLCSWMALNLLFGLSSASASMSAGTNGVVTMHLSLILSSSPVSLSHSVLVFHF